jgi:hypothetical protein
MKLTRLMETSPFLWEGEREQRHRPLKGDVLQKELLALGEAGEGKAVSGSSRRRRAHGGESSPGTLVLLFVPGKVLFVAFVFHLDIPTSAQLRVVSDEVLVATFHHINVRIVQVRVIGAVGKAVHTTEQFARLWSSFAAELAVEHDGHLVIGARISQEELLEALF